MPSRWAGTQMKVMPLWPWFGSVLTSVQWPLGAPHFSHSLGPLTVGLLAVHDEGLLLLVPRRDGLDGTEVAAAAGLGGVDAGERLAGGDGRQHFLLQLIGAVAVDDVRPADGEQ